MVTLEKIEAAAWRIAEVARRTPFERSRWLSTDERAVFLKLECFQTTGAFKIRGAMAKMTALTEEEQARGILTVSAGNHGLAVAHAAEILGLQATILVPESASPAKIEGIGRYPVTLIKRGANYDEAERAARELERESGLAFVSPYNDEEVIAGQGTIGLEMLASEPDLQAIVVPVGGGGLIAGILVAAKSVNPGIKVYGVEPSASPTMTRALEAGRIVEIEDDETIADGLSGNIEPGSITFPIIRDLIDGMILVDESEIESAMETAARNDHIIIEGAAACSLAALTDERLDNVKVGAVISGRNITLELFLSSLSQIPDV
ncbi:MAG: threonine ammonia-lyase [Limisphaerales bacterium]